MSALAFAACRPPPASWPDFERVDLAQTKTPSRRLVLPSSYESFLRGQIAFNDGQHRSAQRFFEASLRSDPRSSYLHAWVARAELARGRTVEARAAIDRALELDECHELALCTAAAVLVEEGDNEGAMRSLRRAIECEPRQPEAYEQLASLLEGEGALRRAEEIWLALSEARPRLATPWRELLRLAVARDAGDEAARYLTVLLELEPWRSDVVIQAAQLAYDRGDTVEARVLLEPLVARAPRDQDVRRLMIRTLLAAGDRAGAASHLERLHPERQDVVQQVELAELFLSAWRWAAAEREARGVLAHDVTHPRARRVLVAALRGLGRIDDAVAAARLERATNQADGVIAEAAFGLWEGARVAEARQLLEQRLNRASDSPRSRALLARMLDDANEGAAADSLLRAGQTFADRLNLLERALDRGRLDDAASVVETVAEDDAGAGAGAGAENLLARLLMLRARFALARGTDFEAAAQVAARAAARVPHDAEVLALVGAIDLARGRQDQGLVTLERAHRRVPGSARVVTLLAEAYAETGRCAEAEALAERGLRLAPVDDDRSRLEHLREQTGCEDADER